MANIKISQMPTATNFEDDDYLMIVQSNKNKKITKANMNFDYAYSSNEIIIGKWIDDKPLYRKVITISGGIASGESTYAHNISNVDIININSGKSFMWNTTIGKSQMLPTNQYDTVDNFDRLDMSVDRTNINILSEGGWGNDWVAYVTLEYTKTTDA